MTADQIESFRKEINRNFFIHRLIDLFCLTVVAAYLIVANPYIGLAFVCLYSFYSYFQNKRHQERIQLLKEVDPCHAVFVGDSYYFKTMKVEDGWFNRSKIYEDEDGLYIYRNNDFVTTSSNETKNKEYLKPHVQKKYKQYKYESLR